MPFTDVALAWGDGSDEEDPFPKTSPRKRRAVGKGKKGKGGKLLRGVKVVQVSDCLQLPSLWRTLLQL